MTESSFSSIQISPELQRRLKHWLNFHRVLWILTLVTFFIAWNRGLALLYGLFSLLFATLLISYLLPIRQLRKISVTRQLCGAYTAGKPGSITYLMESNGARYHVELVDSLEFSEKKELRFFFNKISGRTSCKVQFNCLQRGSFWLRECRLTSAYPFGIINISKEIQSEPIEILIFPKVVGLSRIPMPLVADTTTWGEVPIPQKGGRDEYTTVREYCHGDELNRVHWPVSARHQNLVVKEYEKSDRPSLLVVLNCCQQFIVGTGHLSTFESAITIAASMILFATRKGIQCFFVAHSKRLIDLTIRPYSTDLYTLYETLTRLNCNNQPHYHSIVEHAHRRFPQANLVTTFRLDSDSTQPALAPLTTQIDIEMDKKSFRSPNHSNTSNESRQVGNRLIFRVYANQRLEHLFNEI